jgi:hypothetical protein
MLCAYGVHMKSKKSITACLTALMIGASLFVALPAGAQGGEKYKARLAPAPPLGLRGERGGAFPTPASFVAGSGEANATLSGRKLTVTGKFEKMASAPTVAKVGLGLATGARLDLLYDLTVTKAPEATPPGTSGTIAGTIDLTPAQVDGLKKGKLYIQINSTSAPNGHLLGWLLK